MLQAFLLPASRGRAETPGRAHALSRVIRVDHPGRGGRSWLHDGRVAADPDPERQIRVLVVDDHPVVRRGLTALIESLPGLEVAGEASDGESAVREALLARPDVVLMDVQMPGLSGIEATKRIGVSMPDVPVLMLTMYDDDATVFTAMQAGARGYLLKGADQDEIERALRAVVAGEAIFGPGVAARVLSFFGSGSSSPERDSPFPELTPREREILELLADGRRNNAIATQLHLSPKTVGNHLTAVFAKLRVASREEAIVLAREHGLGVSKDRRRPGDEGPTTVRKRFS
jgi:DNA-binding NarL/FixJ family response regulator